MVVENIVAGGCSFSADGMGGLPPAADYTGGCSFIQPDSQPGSWVGFVAQQLQVNSLVNVAAHSHGNMLTSNSILEILRRYPYNYKTTLVVFNITDPARLDIPCEFAHPDRSIYIPWTEEIIPYSYFKRDICSNFVKSMGIESAEHITTNAVEFLFNFLENNNIAYCFTTLRDYSDHPILGPVIQHRQAHWVSLDPGQGMYDYCQSKNLIGADGFHPNRLGHKLISEQVFNHINISATPGSSDVGSSRRLT